MSQNMSSWIHWEIDWWVTHVIFPTLPVNLRLAGVHSSTVLGVFFRTVAHSTPRNLLHWRTAREEEEEEEEEEEKEEEEEEEEQE